MLKQGVLYLSKFSGKEKERAVVVQNMKCRKGSNRGRIKGLEESRHMLDVCCGRMMDILH